MVGLVFNYTGNITLISGLLHNVVFVSDILPQLPTVVGLPDVVSKTGIGRVYRSEYFTQKTAVGLFKPPQPNCSKINLSITI